MARVETAAGEPKTGVGGSKMGQEGVACHRKRVWVARNGDGGLKMGVGDAMDVERWPGSREWVWVVGLKTK